MQGDVVRLCAKIFMTIIRCTVFIGSVFSLIVANVVTNGWAFALIAWLVILYFLYDALWGKSQ